MTTAAASATAGAILAWPLACYAVQATLEKLIVMKLGPRAPETGGEVLANGLMWSFTSLVGAWCVIAKWPHPFVYAAAATVHAAAFSKNVDWDRVCIVAVLIVLMAYTSSADEYVCIFAAVYAAFRSGVVALPVLGAAVPSLGVPTKPDQDARLRFVEFLILGTISCVRVWRDGYPDHIGVALNFIAICGHNFHTFISKSAAKSD